MRRALTLLAAAAILALAASPARAHHGWSSYDSGTPLDLTGVVKEAGYEHPHGYVRLEVPGNPGKTWMAVLAPPSRMASRGLPREALKPGATVTVVGYPHRTQADEMRAERITVGGKIVELR
jgi:hypothetical protein